MASACCSRKMKIISKKHLKSIILILQTYEWAITT
jgi:hypothetical protein